MAEVVGLVASVATLSEISKVAFHICREFQDAPDEIRHLLEALVRLSSQVLLVRELRVRSSANQLNQNDPVNLAIHRSLTSAETTIMRIDRSLAKLVPRHSTTGRLRWVLFGKEDVKKLHDELQSCQAALMATLMLSQCLGVEYPSSINTSAKQALERDTFQKTTELSMSRPHREDPIEPGVATVAFPQVGVFRSWARSFEVNQLSRCLSALISIIQGEHYTTYTLSMLMRLPFSYMFTLDMGMRACFPTRDLMRMHCSLAVRNVVDNDNPFMVACYRGDIPVMQHMIQNRLIGLNSMNTSGYSPLSLAVKGGSIEAVKLLLHEGVDVNASFGHHASSPLTCAIRNRHLGVARLLLSYGASTQHVTGHGWSPLFYLWSSLGTNPTALDFIEMLASRDDFLFSHAGIFDVWSHGVIHRAAALGQPEDVVALIKLGINPHTPQGTSGWNALHNAICYGRLDVFEALLPYFPNVEVPDIRGWTLLHVAASEGQDAITRRLLELGADWRALTKPSTIDMPDELHERSWTPAGVAMGEGGVEDGRRRQDLFLQALHDVKGVDIGDLEQTHGIDEVWFDAVEEVVV